MNEVRRKIIHTDFQQKILCFGTSQTLVIRHIVIVMSKKLNDSQLVCEIILLKIGIIDVLFLKMASF